MSSTEFSPLQVAIKQMDNIIAGCQEMGSECGSNNFDCVHESTVGKNDKYVLLNELRNLIENDNDDLANDDNGNLQNEEAMKSVYKWLSNKMSDKKIFGEKSTYDEPNIYEKIQFLEVERQNLLLQVNVLSEQVECQANKISHLESILSATKAQLNSTEHLFQETLQTRSKLESTKFDLISELSKLKIEITAVQQAKLLSDERSKKSENDIAVMKALVLEKETEVSALRLSLARLARTTGYNLTDQELGLIKANKNSFNAVKRIIEKPPLPVHGKNSFDSPKFKRENHDLNSAKTTSPTILKNIDSVVTKSNSEENLKEKTNQNTDFAYKTLPHHVKRNLIQNDYSESQSSISKFKPMSTSSPYSLKTLPLSQHTGPSVSFAKEDHLISLSARSLTSDVPKSLVSLNQPDKMSNEHKVNGFAKFFTRIKKGTSSSHGIADSNFIRGGVRSTSGPRLAYSASERRNINVKLQFAQWDTNLVADWFSMIGLSMYIPQWKYLSKNGEYLMKATEDDIEKHLGIKNLLHRKKLRLAVSAMSNSDSEDELLKAAGQLDYLWVAKWLDDIGLPQYKDAFLDARIDGRVLHFLTIQDLFYLKITSHLHYSSIKTGILVLRKYKFNQSCLKRRAGQDEVNASGWNPNEIELWTSHRVMEWLRSIDLSEFAPNLRGAGVHGGLIIYETAFNDDVLSTILSIPNTKTLLRRHIKTHFKQLIGNDIFTTKRELNLQTDQNPLISGAKLKANKHSQFKFMRKKYEMDYEDYVCSMESTNNINSFESFDSSVFKNDNFQSTDV